MAPQLAQRTWSVTRSNRGPLCRLFLVTHGTAQFIQPDRAPLDLTAPTLLWLPCATRGEFRLDPGSNGAVCEAAEEFIWRVLGDSSVLANVRPLLDGIALAASDRLAPHRDELETLFGALIREAREGQPGATAMMGLHLGLILLHLWRASAPMPSSGIRVSGTTTVQRFRQLVELHYRDHLAIDEFSRLIGVTRAGLHDACLRTMGRTPLAVVHDRLIEEARLRLEQTDLSVEQIGYSLGFRDSGYFNRFFKRLTGMSPGQHRKAAGRLRTTGETPSFSAWP